MPTWIFLTTDSLLQEYGLEFSKTIEKPEVKENTQFEYDLVMNAFVEFLKRATKPPPINYNSLYVQSLSLKINQALRTNKNII